MESLNLTETEREFFGELFANIDVDNLGKIPYNRGLEFISTCQLPPDVLEKIIEACGAKRLGHFGRSQFYIAMKLVASAQASMSIKGDAFVISKSPALPTFIPSQLGTPDSKGKQTVKPTSVSHSGVSHSAATERQTLESCQLPPPPAKSSRIRQANVKSGEVISSPVHSGLPEDRLPGGSERQNNGNSSDSSTSPELAYTPKMGSVLSGDRSWVNFQSQSEKSDWRYSEEKHYLLWNEEDSEQGHSSNEEDENGDIWTISEVQKRYYIKQFESLQKDSSGKLAGPIAKEFFEKSKLAQTELSKIWKLSDNDRDGALTCEEFCVAMHLVVLKRNNVEIPDVLPSTLISAKSVQNSPARYENIPDANTSPQCKQWTKFTDSPTNDLITITSPPDCSSSSNVDVMQPANFDFNTASIEKDPKILHPVALRVSPDGQSVPYNSCDILLRLEKPRHAADISSSGYNHNEQGGVRAENYQKPAPPPPPPRPRNLHGHARSSSLDLNRLVKADNPNTGLGAKLHIGAASSNIGGPVCLHSGQHKGAFTAYKRHEQKSTSSWLDHLKQKYPLPAKVAIHSDERDPETVRQFVYQLQERNHLLEDLYLRLISDMADLMDSHGNPLLPRTAKNV